MACFLMVVSSLGSEPPVDRGSCDGDWCRSLEGTCTFLNVFRRHNESTDAELDFTRAAIHPSCIELRLNFAHPGVLGDVGAKSVAAALSHAPNLERLEIGSNYIGDEGAKALALALAQNLKLRFLTLSVSRLGKAAAEAFALLLKNSPIIRLELNSNALGALTRTRCMLPCASAPLMARKKRR